MRSSTDPAGDSLEEPFEFAQSESLNGAPEESPTLERTVEELEQEAWRTSILRPSRDLALLRDAAPVQGPDFNVISSADDVLGSFKNIGFQATQFARAVAAVQQMLSDERGCVIFLAYTSNLISSGIRDVIRYLVEHRLVDVLVTTAGGVEEDLIKTLAPTLIGDFSIPGALLREHGLNRIGNLLVPNANYCQFEDWLMPLLDKMVQERSVWTPSELIWRLGHEMNDESSIASWAAKNSIPYFCPAITDGSLGDMLFYHTYRAESPMILDVVGDIRRLNRIAIHAKCTAMIILGGGVAKHHTCNANLMRNGADYAVYINTGQEYDGSDSGAAPDEAVSWGKIRSSAEPIKVFGDASILFPLLVSQTFCRVPRKHRPILNDELRQQKETIG
jgi:deoxyhypusine synthase